VGGHQCILQGCKTSDQGSTITKVHTVHDEEEDSFPDSADCLLGPIYSFPKGISHKAILPPAAASESRVPQLLAGNIICCRLSKSVALS
jgi:hypothetical protein